MYQILLNYFDSDIAYTLYCAYRVSIDCLLDLLSNYDVPIPFWDYIIDIDDSSRNDLFDCERDDCTIPPVYYNRG